MKDQFGYLKDGQKVEIIQKLNDGRFLVDSVFEDDDEQFTAESPYVVDRVFDSAPEKVFHDKIDTLKAEIESLNNKHYELQKELLGAKEQHEKKINGYKKFDALKYLDAFIEGKLTHYVILDRWHPVILEFNESYSDDRARDKLKLLTLFGNSNGNLTWELNNYKDGSGYNRQVIPCTSLEEAKIELGNFINGLDEISDEIIGIAQRYEIEIKKELLEKYKQDRRRQLMKKIEENKKESEGLTKKLNALK